MIRRDAPSASLLSQLPWLLDANSWALELAPDTSPAGQAAGTWPLGNGKVFAHAGGTPPVNRLCDLVGPRYGFHAFGDCWVELSAERQSVALPYQAVWRPRESGVLVTHAHDRAVSLVTIDYAPPHLGLVLRIVEVWRGDRLGADARITAHLPRGELHEDRRRSLRVASDSGVLILSALGVWLYTRSTRESKKFQTVTGKAFRPRQFDLGAWRWAGFCFLMAYFVFVVLLPFLVLFWASFLPFFATPGWDALDKLSLDNYRYLYGFRPFWDAMQNSIILAIMTATAFMLLTSIVAWIVYKSRLPGSWLLEFLAFVPITVPGIVLGMALILLYVAFPLPIYGTIWILLIAYVTRYIPYGMRSASGSILQIHSELEEAAATSGASWWESFKRVTLPLLRPGFVAGWIYICIVSFREFSTSVLLATGESRVLSILLFTMFEQGQVTIVAAIGILMIATLLAIVAVFYKLSGRFGIQA